MVTMFMASTPNRAKPRSTSIASIRSDGLIGLGGASLAVPVDVVWMGMPGPSCVKLESRPA
jgi:hypothetical protein